MVVYRSAVFDAVAATQLHSIAKLKHHVRTSSFPAKKVGSRPGHSRRERFPNQQLLDVGNHFNDDPNQRIWRTVAHPRPPTTSAGLHDSNRFDRGKLPHENMCIKVMNLGMM